MRGQIIVSKKEVQRGHVLEQVVQGALTLREGSDIMDVSYRQAKRIHRRWREDGLAGLCHRNRGRRVKHAVASETIDKILDLHGEEYKSFNDTHFTEMLAEREGIYVSREKIRQILRASGRRPKRKRRAKKHHARRPRKTKIGIMMQWDGSPHRWFGPSSHPCCLMSAIDDATSKILGARFVPVESSAAYLSLLDMVLRLHGAPLSVYQDRHTTLVRSDNHWSIDEQLQGKQFPTHVGRVLEDLNIKAISALSPQAKGRVERGFGVLQDRLIAELELNGISDMNKANQWLEEHYIPRYNKRFAKQAPEYGKAFVKIAKKERYNKIAFAYEAVVGNDNCIRLGGLLIDISPGKYLEGFAKAKVLVKQHLDGRWTVWQHNKIIATHPPTPFSEPARTWKRRRKSDPIQGRFLTQVYICSKPAPLP